MSKINFNLFPVLLQTGALLHLSQALRKILLHLLCCGSVLWRNQGDRKVPWVE